MDNAMKVSLAAYCEAAARALREARQLGDPDVALALEYVDQLEWVAAALRGRFRPPSGVWSASARSLEAAARRLDDWTRDARRHGMRVRGLGGHWEDVTAMPAHAAIAELGELAANGDDASSLLEERLAGVVFLLSREEEFGATAFREHTKCDLMDLSAPEASRALRKIAASMGLAVAMGDEVPASKS